MPSERDIPVSVNEGVPIVLMNERSEATRAFRELAKLYALGVAEPAPTNGRLKSTNGRLRMMLKRT